jgi:hypothetical protein
MANAVWLRSISNERRVTSLNITGQFQFGEREAHCNLIATTRPSTNNDHAGRQGFIQCFHAKDALVCFLIHSD